jgi:hypothetical protein
MPESILIGLIIFAISQLVILVHLGSGTACTVSAIVDICELVFAIGIWLYWQLKYSSVPAPVASLLLWLTIVVTVLCLMITTLGLVLP